MEPLTSQEPSTQHPEPSTLTQAPSTQPPERPQPPRTPQPSTNPPRPAARSPGARSAAQHPPPGKRHPVPAQPGNVAHGPARPSPAVSREPSPTKHPAPGAQRHEPGHRRLVTGDAPSVSHRYFHAPMPPGKCPPRTPRARTHRRARRAPGCTASGSQGLSTYHYGKGGTKGKASPGGP